MVKSPQPTKDYLNLEEEFKNLAQTTENSEYIPNPYLSHSPKYFLIGEEPGPGMHSTTVKYEQPIEYISSFKNIIMHYCAYHYLCEESFDYHFTDISKQFKKSKDANKKGGRDDNELWYPLLEKEVKILSPKDKKPVILAPKTLYNKRLKVHTELDNIETIYHWGNLTNTHMKKYFEKNADETINFDKLEIEIKDFALKLMKYIGLPESDIKLRMERIFKEYTEKGKNQLYYRYYYYKTRFTEIKKKHD